MKYLKINKNQNNVGENFPKGGNVENSKARMK